MRFDVWAPRAERSVDLVVDGERVAMAPAERGWWSAQSAGSGHGARYGFSIDGGPVRPDPRSPSQPDGVHGLSAVVDHARFDWNDEGWRGVPLPTAVVYELHVGTFTPAGTFDSAIEKLPHLVDLGVDVVELMPVNEFPGTRGWGYDGASLFAAHSGYGGPDGLKRLVDACHRAGLAVVVDVVYNHLGPSGNYLAEFGPYFTDRYSTPWGMAVNLDGGGSDEVRRFFLDNARLWLEDYHCDGLRLDAVHALVDTSALHILEELAVEVRALEASLGRTLSLIAESDLNDPRVVARHDVGGYGIDAQWSDDFHHALHAVLTGERSGYYADFGSLEQLATALRRAFVHAGEYAPHRDRRHGREPVGIPGWRFLGYLQDHDQVGNRAVGERSSHLMNPELLRVGAGLVLTSPFVPMLFMGEEWGASTPFQYFTDHEEPGLGRAVSEGRRREFASFGWQPEDVPDPQSVETFERSVLDWGELTGPGHDELLSWHRELIAFRRSHPALADGRLDLQEVDVDGVAGHLTIRRGQLEILVNLAPTEWILEPAGGRIGRIVLSSTPAVSIGDEGRTVPPKSLVIID